MPVEAVAVDEEAVRVMHWRVHRFLEVGFTLRQARVLAAGDADWHEAAVLLAAGCPTDTAFDVLS